MCGAGQGDFTQESLTIVMPVYNEEEIIEKTINDCQRYILAKFSTGEIVVVNDCSTDKTAVILKKISKKNKQLRVLSNDVNLGHGASLIRAINAASGKHILLMDSDYQHNPQEFWRLYEQYNGKNIIIGQRKNRAEGGYRFWMSSTGNYMMCKFFALSVKDINIPFKLLSRNILNTLVSQFPEKTLVPSALLVVAAKKMNIPVIQVSVSHLRRSTGRGSLQGWKYLKFCFRAASELLEFNRKQF